MQNLEIAKDQLSLAEIAADKIIALTVDSIHRQGQFTIALAGGSTPRGIYTLLATLPNRSKIDWKRVFIFWGDERNVPPENTNSNYQMVKQTLLDHVPIPTKNIYRIEGELDPNIAALQYEQNMRSFFSVPYDEFPSFDLILLGLGEDGHTASLFPETKALDEKARWVAENYVPKLNEWRITFTIPLINSSANIIIVVSGEQKADIIKDVLGGNNQSSKSPIESIRPKDGNLLWLVDQAAASKLSPPK